MRIKYVLVSQGIKIYETYDKEEAERIAKEDNSIDEEVLRRYYENCIESNLPCDNKIFVEEEYE